MKLDCGHEPSPSEIGTGYGMAPDGARHCYDCCAKHENAAMAQTGRAILYDCDSEVTNWPGTLRFPINTGARRKGRHNMARVRYDVWFRGPKGTLWHGVRYGDNTQLLHCKRIKG